MKANPVKTAQKNKQKPAAEPRDIPTGVNKPENRRLRRYLGLLFAFWVVIVVTAWFAVHRPFSVDVPHIPFSTEIAAAVGRTLANIGVLALITLGCGAAGLRILQITGLDKPLAAAEKALFAFGVGLGSAIFAVLLVGLLGGLNAPVMYGLLAAFLLLNPHQCLWILNGFAKFLRLTGKWLGEACWWERLLSGYLFIAVMVPFVIALGPVYSWDSLMYHLVVPKLYVETGRVEAINELPPASYPAGIEMLFTWALVLRDDGLAQLIHWLFGMLSGAAIWVVSIRFTGDLDKFGPRTRQKAALLTSVLFFSIPLVQLLESWAYTDLLIVFYALLGVFALLLAVENSGKKGSSGLVALSGVFGGLAFSGKYTAVMVTIAIFAAGLYFALVNRKFSWRIFLSWSFIFGIAAFLTAAPWLVRNWFFTGNPFAPLFWGVNGWHPDEIAPIVGKGANQSFSLEMALGRPVKASIFGTAGGDMDATISPLFLAFFPLAVWGAWRNKANAAYMLVVGLQYCIWLAVIVSTAQLDHTRILLPAFPFLALATGYGLVALPGLKMDLLKLLVPLVTGIFLLGNVLSMGLWFAANDTIPYMAGMQTKNDYLENFLGSHYRAARFVNNQLPADSFVFFLFEPRSYYFTRHVQPDLNGGEIFYILDDLGTPEKMQAELKRRGVTHLLVWEAGLKFLQENPNYVKPERAQAAARLLNDYITRYLKPVYTEKGEYSIYTLLQ